ncbi:MAG: DUF5691 domain-containing protein [Saprospiraceae bacterium]|nr:DUF5691 domain-containing protein [Saprospiraceae bacterium]
MESWKIILEQLLMGTAARPELSPSTESFLSDHIQGSQNVQKIETNLLTASSTHALLQKTSSIPQKFIETQVNTIPPKAKSEQLPECSAKTRTHLIHSIKNAYDEILVELISQLEQHQQRIPFELLPDIFTYALAQQKIQVLLHRSVGHRGLWLSQFNPKWNFIQVNNYGLQQINIFTHGKRLQRLSYLRQIRTQNPKQALELIQTYWSKESKKNKISFLEILEVNLSDLDLTFLEDCLQHPTLEVQQTSATLLNKIPNSAFNKELALYLFQIFKPKTLEINLTKDHLTTKKLNHYKILPEIQLFDNQPKEKHIIQLLCLLPPQLWETYTSINSLDFVDQICIQQSKYFMEYLWAMAKASKKFGDNALWIKCHQWYQALSSQRQYAPQTNFDFLYDEMPNKVLNQICLDLLKQDGQDAISEDHPVVNLLLLEEYQWTDLLALEVVQRIQNAIARDSYVFHWSLKAVLKRAAVAVNPNLYDKVQYNWPEQSPSWHSWKLEVENFLAILDFRKEILAEFNKTGSN